MDQVQVEGVGSSGCRGLRPLLAAGQGAEGPRGHPFFAHAGQRKVRVLNFLEQEPEEPKAERLLRDGEAGLRVRTARVQVGMGHL